MNDAVFRIQNRLKYSYMKAKLQRRPLKGLLLTSNPVILHVKSLWANRQQLLICPNLPTIFLHSVFLWYLELGPALTLALSLGRAFFCFSDLARGACCPIHYELKCTPSNSFAMLRNLDNKNPYACSK